MAHFSVDLPYDITNDEQPRNPEGALESHNSTPSLHRHLLAIQQIASHTRNTERALHIHYASFLAITKRQHTTPKSVSIIQKNIFCTLPAQNSWCLLSSAGRCEAAAAPATLVRDRGVQREPPVAIVTTPFPGSPSGRSPARPYR
jgi:hypothetical protein